jgi:hypothetical protein
MKTPDHSPYFSAHHAIGSFTPSNTPGLKNSHHTAPNFITPQANNALPQPGAADLNPPMVDNTVASLAFSTTKSNLDGRDWGWKVRGVWQFLLVVFHIIRI